MKHGCPNSKCINYEKTNRVVKDGSFFRKDDSRTVHRFRCMSCGRRFSSATYAPAFGQKKRRKNAMVRHLLCSNMSMRRVAKVLRIHRITVARKLEFLSEIAVVNHASFLIDLESTPVTHLQFDDLITHEHTKLKPLTVTIAIDADARSILGAEVNQIGAFGKIARLSRTKYGRRQNNHKQGLADLFTGIQKIISPSAEIRSDEHKYYKPFVKQFFPLARYQQYESEKAKDDGQGELKVKLNDPLFYINHTLAMFRANINRLIRRTWCTTKRADRLAQHIALFIHYHNQELI